MLLEITTKHALFQRAPHFSASSPHACRALPLEQHLGLIYTVLIQCRHSHLLLQAQDLTAGSALEVSVAMDMARLGAFLAQCVKLDVLGSKERVHHAIVFEPIEQPVYCGSVHISWQALHQKLGRQRLLRVAECIEHQFKVSCFAVYAHDHQLMRLCCNNTISC